MMRPIGSSRLTPLLRRQLSMRPACIVCRPPPTMARLLSSAPSPNGQPQQTTAPAPTTTTTTKSTKSGPNNVPGQQARKAYYYPERLLIYHSGTARTTIIGLVKVAVLIAGVFFTVVVAPAMYRSGDQPAWKPAAVVACGALAPLAATLYAAGPHVAFVRLRLPPAARASPDALRRHVLLLLHHHHHHHHHHQPPQLQSPPPPLPLQGPAALDRAVLEVGTVGSLGRPRVTLVPVASLVPRHERLGLVNWVVADGSGRHQSAAPPRRRWSWLLGPPTKLSIRDEANEAKEAWVWDAIADAAQKRNGG